MEKSAMQNWGARVEVSSKKKLTNVNHGSCSLTDDLKVTEFLRNRMGGEKVFLALDNVWQESKEEAMVYVHEVRYACGSIVLVTARSIDILDSLKFNRRDCFEMPELEEEDARQLLLHQAAPGFQSMMRRIFEIVSSNVAFQKVEIRACIFIL